MLSLSVASAVALTNEMDERFRFMRQALVETPAATDADRAALQGLWERFFKLRQQLSGDTTITSRHEPAPVSIASRASNVYAAVAHTQSKVGGMLRDSYDVAASEYKPVRQALATLAKELSEFEQQLDLKGAPWTPGRIPAA